MAQTQIQLSQLAFSIEVTKSSDYTIAVTDAGKRLVATAALTFTVPSVGTLGNGFAIDIVNDSGGTVTINGPGATNVSMADGEVATLLETNGKQRVAKGSTTIVS